MRKGHKFEEWIEKKVMRGVEALGCHWHKNEPRRTLDGVFIAGEPFDYEVFMPDGTDVFDAKDIRSKAWYLKDKDLRQCNELVKCGRAGCRAYFLLRFDGTDVRAISAIKTAAILAAGCRTVTRGDCTDWELIDRIKKRLPRTEQEEKQL